MVVLILEEKGGVGHSQDGSSSMALARFNIVTMRPIETMMTLCKKELDLRGS